MEEAKKIIVDEEALFNALEYYRLKKDLEIIDEKIKDNAPEDVTLESNKIKEVFKDKVLNPLKKNKVDHLSENKKKILANIDRFVEANGNLDKSDDELKDMVSSFFEKDIHGEARILMGLKLALASEYKYEDEKKSLECVSNILFDNLTKIGELKEELKKNYFQINRKNLNEFDKNLWKGLGIVAAASLVAGPIGTIVATMNKDVKTSLNDLTYAGKNVGVAALTLSTVTLNVFLVGACASCIGMSELKKDESLKAEYRKITSDSLAMRFAIKATIIEEIKKKGDKEVLTLCLDDALQVLDNYRADSEYMLIVEDKADEDVRRKITICNNLVSRLAEISK